MSIITDNDHFIFDWDGTLSSSSLIVAASRLFVKRYDPEYIKKNEDKYRRTVKNLEIHETKSMAFAWLYDAYVKLFPPAMKSGSVDLLKYLRKKGKTITIFSDSKSYRLMSELRMLGVFDYFDFVLSASSVGRYKPDPTGILIVMNKYRIPRSRCVYIGDTASDILTAKFAGISSCAVGDGLEPYSKLVTVEPDYIYRNLKDIVKNRRF
jgi:HAD superfamily hydrolase (TIGR01509 family)